MKWVKKNTSQINRDHDLACYVEAFPVLKQHITYDFEPCDNDNVTQVRLRFIMII